MPQHWTRLTIIGCLLGAAMAAALSETTSRPASQPAVNLLENGDFEIWRDLTAAEAKQDQVRSVQLVPPGKAPAAWLPYRERYKNESPTATIAMDESVKHGGKRSVRIENRDGRDISCVKYTTENLAARKDDPRNIRPNRRYQLRWWVKGEGVEPAGAGPILMMFVTSVQDHKTYRTNASEESPLLKGTFDWQQRHLTFVTDEHAQSLTFSLQLRWATGTVWFDDVELVDLGPAIHVETY